MAGISWGSVPDWVSAAAFWGLTVEVYVRWKQNPERPPLSEELEPTKGGEKHAGKHR